MEKIVIGKAEGKTLLEKMLSGKDGKAKTPEAKIYNPLQLAINDMVELTFEEAGTYEVCQIAAYTTRLETKTYHSTRYVLRDPAAVEDSEPLLLEIMESGHTEITEQFLFHLTEEFEYDEEFTELLEDDFFIITEELEEEIVEQEYEKTFHVTSEMTRIEADRSVNAGKVDVWNYEREEELETCYLVIEIDASNGWITLYEGRKLLEGELELYRLSDGA